MKSKYVVTTHEYRIYKYLQSVYPEWKTSSEIAKVVNLYPFGVSKHLLDMDVERDNSDTYVRYRCKHNELTDINPFKKRICIKELHMEFPSMTECAQYLKCTRTRLGYAIKNNKTIEGYHLEVLE